MGYLGRWNIVCAFHVVFGRKNKHHSSTLAKKRKLVFRLLLRRPLRFVRTGRSCWVLREFSQFLPTPPLSRTWFEEVRKLTTLILFILLNSAWFTVVSDHQEILRLCEIQLSWPTDTNSNSSLKKDSQLIRNWIKIYSNGTRKRCHFGREKFFLCSFHICWGKFIQKNFDLPSFARHESKLKWILYPPEPPSESGLNCLLKTKTVGCLRFVNHKNTYFLSFKHFRFCFEIYPLK